MPHFYSVIQALSHGIILAWQQLFLDHGACKILIFLYTLS